MKNGFFRLVLSAMLTMCCTIGASAQLDTPPNDEIWYLTQDGGRLDDDNYDVGETLCGHTIISHDFWFGKYIIKLSGDVTAINDEAFYDEDDLMAISLPNTVVQIGGATDGTGVFEDCDNLKSVNVPPSVKYIGRCAFYDCTALESFSCDSVEIIYPEAFYNCESLKSVNLGTKLKEIRWSDQGNEYGAFEDCDALEAIAIPASVTHIGQRAFYWCNNLKFVAIGSGVREIAEEAFYNCNELKCVAIDGNVETIGEDAFNDCEKLESVAFLGNTPPSSFGDDCFDDCSPNLKYYVLEEYYDSYNSKSFLRGKVVAGPPYNEIWYTTNNGETAEHLLDVNRPALNTCMGNHCVQFYNGNLPEFSYSGTCFCDCNNLVSAVLPSSITYIGHSAFCRCSNLVSVSIPSTVTGIGDYAFNRCTNLVSISIPNKVTGIGSCAFEECTSLQNIILPDELIYIGDFAFVYCYGLQSVIIPDMVSTISERAFYLCSALKDVTIGNSVTSIGEDAFNACSSLQSVTFKSVPLLKKDVFWSCYNISSTILDLTDSDKPYIGTSLDNYPAGRFTEARYHRTLEPDKWGTIVLPFKPSAESTANLKFYALSSMTIGGEDGGTLTFTKVDAPEAGIPYLFRNEGESADFTLTAEAPSSITLETQEIGTNFKMKGSFKADSLNTTEKPNDKLYYLKDNQFYHANGRINISPFRAYIEGNSVSTVQSFMLVISDNGENITAVPGIVDGNGEIDETEAIYDLSGHRLDAPVEGQVNIIRLKSGKTIKKMF